ncbi:MAG: hypothetical protein ABFD92_11985 [Planctomycetaceae bacterium]|nr:hypothetical protein [Planctomycetaceae bacterium]
MNGSDCHNLSGGFPLALRAAAGTEPPCLKSDIPKMRARRGGVYRSGERRCNFFRRWLWRGVDELRRQQTAPDPPPIGGLLDLKT